VKPIRTACLIRSMSVPPRPLTTPALLSHLTPARRERRETAEEEGGRECGITFAGFLLREANLEAFYCRSFI